MTTIKIKDDNGNIATVSENTAEKVNAARKAGAIIIINKNWQTSGELVETEIGEKEIKLCQTNNSTRNGGIKHIVWAVYKVNRNNTEDAKVTDTKEKSKIEFGSLRWALDYAKRSFEKVLKYHQYLIFRGWHRKAESILNKVDEFLSLSKGRKYAIIKEKNDKPFIAAIDIKPYTTHAAKAFYIPLR